MLCGFKDGAELIVPDTFPPRGPLQDPHRMIRQCRHGPATARPFDRTVADLGERVKGSGVIRSGPLRAVLRRARRRRVALGVALGQVAEHKQAKAMLSASASVCGSMPVTRRL